MNVNPLDDLAALYRKAVERADPYEMIKGKMVCTDSTLEIHTETQTLRFDLDSYDNIVVMGAGKATVSMATAVEEILAERITEGVIATKYGHGDGLRKIEIIEAGHPVPDENSVRAAAEITRRARAGDNRTLFVNLISGGGSALLSYPAEHEIRGRKLALRLEEKQKVTELLLACGATIQEMNCVRKHLSLIKGGQLAALMAPAESINLILSDVVGDRLDTIASGLTAEDTTSFGEALSILEKYSLKRRIPQKALQIIEAGSRGEIEETPSEQDSCFERVHNVLIGTNYHSLVATEAEAKKRGYRTSILSSQVTGEAKEIAKLFLGVARDMKERNTPLEPPACLLAGGETTVTIKGDGKGGRNQEMALSFVAEATAQKRSLEGIYFLSGATDGNDGPTDAAGGFCCEETITAVRKKKLDPFEYLRENDAYTFFDKIGYLFKPGPTGTNVCDVHIVLVI
jgi:hydroxypyruvate reductase